MNNELTAANCQQHNRAELIAETHICVCIPLASNPETVAAMLRNAFPDSVSTIALTILIADPIDVMIVN